MKKKKKFLVVLGGGGHTLQMIKLLDLLGKRYIYEYVVKYEDPLSNKKIKIKGKTYKFHEPRAFRDNFFVTIFKLMRNIIESLIILFKSRPDVIISAGAGPAVPISILGKFFGIKIIFLESWSRVYNPSVSGKIVYHFADLFFVQWPDLLKKYPKAIYAGRLM